MNGIPLSRGVPGRWWLVIGLLLPATVWAEAPVIPATQITLTRLSDQLWRADYEFDAPVAAFRVYPAQLDFRRTAWRILTPGLVLTEEDDGARIHAAGAPFGAFAIEFSADPDFTPKTYVPVMPFSDGGAAVYTGHFSGDVLAAGEWWSSPTQFRLVTREGEHGLLPAWADEQHPVYLYAGPAAPAETARVRVIADPDLPDWLRESFSDAAPAAVGVFTEQLDFALDDEPIVLIAAGQLREFDGYSVKGGGLDGQFTVMLRGTELIEASPERQAMFEKMVAHELVHVWQAAMPGGAANEDQPWLHEGSAEALAVAALVQAGLWSREDAEQYHASQARQCAAALGDQTLTEAAASGNWDAIYACGYLEFNEGVADPFRLWLDLTRAAAASGQPYSQALLESVRAQHQAVEITAL